MNKPTGGPAFPTGTAYQGMTLRDYFAAKAMQGVLAGLDRDARRFMECQEEPIKTLAEASWSMADAMLKVRGER
jgi:hypothetical protein